MNRWSLLIGRFDCRFDILYCILARDSSALPQNDLKKRRTSNVQLSTSNVEPLPASSCDYAATSRGVFLIDFSVWLEMTCVSVVMTKKRGKHPFRGKGWHPGRKPVNIVILNGTKRSEESLVHKGLRFFAALRMTFRID